MALEDFERELAESQRDREKEKEREKRREKHRERHRDHDHDRHRDRDRDRDREKDKDRESRHRSDRHKPHSSRHNHSNHSDEEHPSGRKRSRHHSSHNTDDRERSHKRRHHHESREHKHEDKAEEKQKRQIVEQEEPSKLQRDAWMEAPSALDIDFVQRRVLKPPSPKPGSLQAEFEQRLHEKELNRHLHDLRENEDEERAAVQEPLEHEVDYEFGDSGSQWRMTKLKAVYRQAEETGRKVEDVAIERFGDLRSFDDAREEEIELDRRERYGDDYVGKIKPSGELYEERRLELGVRREDSAATPDEDIETPPQGERMETNPPPQLTKPLDSTALNRLKAQMMKAKIRGSSDAAQLEAEYNAAVALAANRRESDVVVLGVMENRMLAGGQRAEAKPVDNKRGRERGLVQENEDMSIEDMVREERRTKGQAGGEGMRFAERIAKDAKFDVRLSSPVY